MATTHTALLGKDRKPTIRNKKLFIEEMKRNLGHMSKSCKKIGITHRTYYNWLEDPEFKAELDEINVERKDIAEHALIKGIKEGEASLIKFYLERKVDGYREKKQISTDVTLKEDSAKKLEELYNELNGDSKDSHKE